MATEPPPALSEAEAPGPMPSLDSLLLLLMSLAEVKTATKTALVLQGGGAKGAFQAGVLQQLCEGDLADSWTLLAGTSIGALNAAFLAQYAPQEQCTRAVPALVIEWQGITAITDLMVRTGTNEPCGLQSSAVSKHVTGLYLLQDLDKQNAGGFTCDMTPALKRYTRILDANKIRASGMQLSAPAVSLETGLVKYFNETMPADEIFSGVVASGTLTPIVPPTVIGGERFMDGGVRANLPILQALHRDADRIVAVLLNPVEMHQPAQFPAPNQPDQFLARLHFLIDVFYDAEFMDDMREACFRFPRAEIMAYIPKEYIGSLLDFNSASIGQFLEKGRTETRFVKDFCAELGFERGPLPSWIIFAFGVGALTGLIGACRLAYLIYVTCHSQQMRSFKFKVEPDEDLERMPVIGRSLE